MNAVRYLEIMERMLLPRFQTRGCTNYQQDSAHCHTEKICKPGPQRTTSPSSPGLGTALTSTR